MTVQIATADDAFRARNPIKDEVDGALYIYISRCAIWIGILLMNRSLDDLLNKNIFVNIFITLETLNNSSKILSRQFL